MADISITREIKLSKDDYETIVNSKPTDKLKKILNDLKKTEELPRRKNKLIEKYK